MNKRHSCLISLVSVVSITGFLSFREHVAFDNERSFLGDLSTVSRFLHSAEQQNPGNDDDKEDSPEMLPSSDPVYGGSLTSGMKTGSISLSTPSIYYTLSTSDTAAAFGVMAIASCDVKISIFPSNADYGHPTIVGTNSVAFFPVFSNRTMHVAVSAADPTHPFFSFSIVAQQTTTPTSGYIRYSPPNKTMDLCSFSGNVSNLNLTPQGSTDVNSSDIGSPDEYDLYPVIGTGSPFDSVAHMVNINYYESSSHGWVGTGFRVRPNLFATNAHNVFDSNRRVFISSSTMEPGKAGSSVTTSYSVTAFSVPVGYLFGTDAFNHDFALVETTGDTATNSLGMCANHTLVVDDELYMLGYPSPYEHGYIQQYSFGDLNSISTTDNYLLSTIPADGAPYGGSSGSPVFHDGVVVGINNGSVTMGTSVFEHAVLFDSAIQSLVTTLLLA